MLEWAGHLLWTTASFFRPFFLSTAKSLAREIICIESVSCPTRLSSIFQHPKNIATVNGTFYSKFWQNFDKNVYSVLIFMEVSKKIVSSIFSFSFAFWAVTLPQSLQRGRPPTPRCPLCNRFGFLNFGLLACLDHFARISFAFEIIFRN